MQPSTLGAPPSHTPEGAAQYCTVRIKIDRQRTGFLPRPTGKAPPDVSAPSLSAASRSTRHSARSRDFVHTQRRRCAPRPPPCRRRPTQLMIRARRSRSCRRTSTTSCGCKPRYETIPHTRGEAAPPPPVARGSSERRSTRRLRDGVPWRRCCRSVGREWRSRRGAAGRAARDRATGRRQRSRRAPPAARRRRAQQADEPGAGRAGGERA